MSTRWDHPHLRMTTEDGDYISTSVEWVEPQKDGSERATPLDSILQCDLVIEVDKLNRAVVTFEMPRIVERTST